MTYRFLSFGLGTVLSLLLGLASPGAAAAGSQTEFKYDAVGNLRYLSTPSGATYYDYDVLDRLTDETGPAKTQHITYDGNGNRLSDGGGALTYPGGQAPSNRLATRYGAQYTYDGQKGNITGDGTFQYVYTKRGQIAQVKQGTTIIASYSYDYRNRRTRKTAGGVTTVYHYDQWDHLIAETTTANIPLKTYAYRDDVPVAQIEHGSTPKVVYLHTDNLGTPRAGRDSQRLTVWSWNSDAFGSTLANSDPDGNSVLTTVNLRFPGQYYDAESGLHYNNQRFYDPKLGRYLQSDPIGLEGGINTYAYVANNPLLYTDPFGLNPGAAAGAFVGSIALPGVGTVAGAAIGSAIGFVLGWWIIDNSRASGEEKLPNVNPGKDCNGNCNPCPPGKRWWVPKPGHGHENGYWHTIIYNQNKETCECFSDRPSSGLDGS